MAFTKALSFKPPVTELTLGFSHRRMMAIPLAASSTTCWCPSPSAGWSPCNSPAAPSCANGRTANFESGLTFHAADGCSKAMEGIVSQTAVSKGLSQITLINCTQLVCR